MQQGLEQLTLSLLEWFDAAQRDLPWRRTRDPYAILVSEVMLQQTRVEVVEERYRRFLGRFPTVQALAEAEVDAVLAEWSGLGYYRRARSLHRAAREVVERGGFPQNSVDLRSLPGIGPYTSAAVASIAFSEEIAVLDGNVQRVICRIDAIADDPARAATRRRILATATGLLDRQRPGDSNQALMELGATVCLPRNPNCARCPLQSGCSAFATGSGAAYPKLQPRRKTEAEHWIQIVSRDPSGRLLLRRRAERETFLPGVWGLPTLVSSAPEVTGLEREDSGLLSDSREQLQSRLKNLLGGSWTVERRLGEIRHSITYRRIRALLCAAEVSIETDSRQGWFAPGEVDQLHTSSMLRKALQVERGGAAPA
jgi:A/G-specific adenine glycosylase